MEVISKLFGPSKLQEEFQKSITLKLLLIISSINEIEFSIRDIQLKKKNSTTNIIFDFSSNLLFIKGDLFEELTKDTCFLISRINKLSDTTEIFISRIGSSNLIIMKCLIYRNSISFQGTLENWHCEISKDIKISH